MDNHQDKQLPKLPPCKAEICERSSLAFLVSTNSSNIGSHWQKRRSFMEISFYPFAFKAHFKYSY